MGSSKSSQHARDPSSSRSRISMMEEPAIVGQSTVDPTSSSQSLSSARKRHFREVDQASHHQSHDDGEEGMADNDQDGSPRNQKRSRPSPRTSDVGLQEFGSLSSTHRRHKPTASSASDRPRLHARRSSRFTEGSMRDRASQCPPYDFTQAESVSSRSRSEQRGRASSETRIPSDAGKEEVRPSGVRRLGKALSTTFKPALTYQDSNGRNKDTRNLQDRQEQNLLNDRRLRAETAYARLQRNNHPGTSQRPMHTSHASTSRINLGGESTDYQALLKRNSYADRMEDSVVRGSNRNRPIAHTIEYKQEAPSPIPDLNIISTVESISQENPVISPLTLEHPLSGLKKVKSYFRFPNARGRSQSPSKASPSVAADQSNNLPNSSPLKESPSKRDLKKQKKLMNKISNLEDKLEHAKRNLRMSLDEAPPIPNLPAAYTVDTENLPFRREPSVPVNPIPPRGPSKFVPGLLPSLPSERLLNPEDRAVHEEMLRRKALFVEEDAARPQIRKELSKVSPELLSGRSDPATLEHSSQSNSFRAVAPLPVKKKLSSSRFRVGLTCARDTDADSEHEYGDYLYCDARTNPSTSTNFLESEQSQTFIESKMGKDKIVLQGQGTSPDLEAQPNASPTRTSHILPTLRRHQRSSSRTLVEIPTESLNQSYNQCAHTHLRRDDQGNNRVSLTRSRTQRHRNDVHVPPVPKVPHGIAGTETRSPGGKENRARDGGRLSGVREEEDFAWDEDVF